MVDERERRQFMARLELDGMARTPENQAFVNGRHAERSGWVPYDLERFCRRFKHDPTDPKSARLYEAFQTGRRAEAHEATMTEETE